MTIVTPYQATSETSKSAAFRAAAFAKPQAQRILDWLRAQGARGGTQREASEALGISRQSCAPRFVALEDQRLIRKLEHSRRDGCSVYRLASPQGRLW